MHPALEEGQEAGAIRDQDTEHRGREAGRGGAAVLQALAAR